jgi:hypothetical protein
LRNVEAGPYRGKGGGKKNKGRRMMEDTIYELRGIRE